MARTRKTTTGATKKTGATRSTGASSIASEQNSKVLSNSAEDNGECIDRKARCRTLIIDGDKYRTRLNTKFENRKVWDNPNPKKILSTIPGTIVKLYIKVGQDVKKGEPILILEAMKMKNKILFHADGRVKAIRVKEGEKVPKDHLMLELA
jgi:pyruvate carboxylase